MSGLRFEVGFCDPGATEFPEDHTLADLGIAVGNDYLTRHAQRARLVQGGRKFTNTVHGPVAGLADWLIENWSYVQWEAQTPFRRGRPRGSYLASPAIPGAKEAANKWEGYIYSADGDEYYDFYVERLVASLAGWQHRHLLGHGRSDLAIPSIVIVPEDRTILLCVDRLPKGSMAFYGPDNTPRTPTQYVVAREDFRAAAAGFVEDVIGHVESGGKQPQWAEWMRRRWRDAQDAEGRPARQLELMLGEIGAHRVEDLRRSDPVIASGMRRMLLDCRVAQSAGELDQVEKVLRDYVGANGARHLAGDIPSWEQLTDVSVPLDQPEFIQGYTLARHVRKQMKIGNKPIPGVAAVLKRLDVSLEGDRHVALFRAAACARRGHEAHIIPSSSDPRMKFKASRDFAVLSALGRLVWEARSPDESTICVAQGDYSILSESRRANAFAAEFLLPTPVVSKLKYQSPELLEVADKYGISHEAANWHALDIERLSKGRGG